MAASNSTDSESENSKCMINKFNSGCALLSSALTRTPFFRPNNNNNINNNKFNHSPIVFPIAVGDLHDSIVSTADRCFRMVRMLAAENPFFSKIMSMSSDFRYFSQMPCRNTRNLNFLSNQNFAAIIPGDSVAGVVVANGVMNFLNLYNTILVVRPVLTWFPNSPLAIVAPLSTASALSAELPFTRNSQESTSSQKKWNRRLDGNKPKSSTGII